MTYNEASELVEKFIDKRMEEFDKRYALNQALSSVSEMLKMSLTGFDIVKFMKEETK